MTVNTYDHEDSVVIAERPRLPLISETGNKSMTLMSLDSHQYQMVDDDGDACRGKGFPDKESSRSTSTDYNYVYSEAKVYWDKFRKNKAKIRTVADGDEERYASSYDYDRRHDKENGTEDDSMVTNMLYTMPGKGGDD